MCDSAIEREEWELNESSSDSSDESYENDLIPSENNCCYSVSVLYAFQMLFGDGIIFMTGLMNLIDKEALDPRKENVVMYEGYHRVFRRFGVENMREFYLRKTLSENTADCCTQNEDENAYQKETDSEFDNEYDDVTECCQEPRELDGIPTLRDCARACLGETVERDAVFEIRA